MRPLDTVIAAAELAGGSDLYRDYVLGRATPVHAVLGSFHATAPDWRRVAGAHGLVDASLVEHLVEYNHARGASAETIARARGLADGSVRAVVTGQQPGVAGGPLMTLHKIATARALARAVEARDGTRCVPVFWLGADDDDFAEIRELATMSAGMALVSVSLPADAAAPGKRVGDIAASAVQDVWRSVGPLLPADAGVAEAVGRWLEAARDFGDAAARCIIALCGGNVLVLDGREARLRTCTRDLLLAFFDREEELRASVAGAGDALTKAGYHAQLDLGDSSGLFLVDDGVRRRVPREKRAAARERFAADIGAVSPGVVARNLMQDAALNPLAVVLGPAEIAYRAQLGDVYDRLGVTRPVVFPRMTATFVPPPVRELLDAAGLDPAILVRDPAGASDAARDRLKDAGFGAAARAAREEFDALAQRFGGVASQRLDARSKEKLDRRLADIAQRLTQALDGAVAQDTASAAARFPFLAGMSEVFVRAGAPQERYLSMTAPYAYHGDGAWRGVCTVADAFCASALDGGVAHRVYSL